MTQKGSRHGPPVREIADAMPTPERSNHGIVERLERTISDTSGRPARPLSLCRHARRYGKTGFDYRGNAAGWRGFPRLFCRRATRPAESL
jgi:hypothetical protein